MGYSFRLTARVFLYAPSYRQDNTYHGLCYPSHGALAGTTNSSMGVHISILIRMDVNTDFIYLFTVFIYVTISFILPVFLAMNIYFFNIFVYLFNYVIIYTCTYLFI